MWLRRCEKAAPEIRSERSCTEGVREAEERNAAPLCRRAHGCSREQRHPAEHLSSSSSSSAPHTLHTQRPPVRVSPLLGPTGGGG